MLEEVSLNVIRLAFDEGYKKIEYHLNTPKKVSRVMFVHLRIY